MEFKNKKILVYGSGKSGQGARQLLEKVGASPFIYDDSMGELPSLHEIEAAVVSPGVPMDNPHVKSLKEAGIPVIGEIELAYLTGKGRVLAVTGTNGKTTTTSLLGAIMRAWKSSVFVVGNIGTPYTGAALDTTEDSVVVAEISSFQLESIETFHPSVSAILNITEDHLNRHHTMAEYIRVKESITRNQTAEDVCVLNYEDPELRAFGKLCPARVIWFSGRRRLEDGYYLEDHEIFRAEKGERVRVLNVDELKLIGVHNYENVMAALAMACSAGVPLDTACQAAKAFTAVEHRIEYVGTKKGVVWYNDSKGTNPDAAIKGIEAMKWPTLLIGGGYDKGSDYRPWIESFGGRVKYLVLEGKTRFDIQKAALEAGFPSERIILRENMTEAMDFCAAMAEPGDAVLLSPACASWGEFPNYEVRGDAFKEYFKKL